MIFTSRILGRQMHRRLAAANSLPRLTRWAATAIAAASLVVMSSCSTVEPASTVPDGNPIDAARNLSDAGGTVSSSDPSASCGEYVLEQGGELPGAARECLVSAATVGDEAQLAWSAPTSEGDPIVSFAFVGGLIDGVHIYSTTAFDRHNGLEEPAGHGASWSLTACVDPGDLYGAGECERYYEG